MACFVQWKQRHTFLPGSSSTPPVVLQQQPPQSIHSTMTLIQACLDIDDVKSNVHQLRELLQRAPNLLTEQCSSPTASSEKISSDDTTTTNRKVLQEIQNKNQDPTTPLRNNNKNEHHKQPSSSATKEEGPLDSNSPSHVSPPVDHAATRSYQRGELIRIVDNVRDILVQYIHLAQHRQKSLCRDEQTLLAGQLSNLRLSLCLLSVGLAQTTKTGTTSTPAHGWHEDMKWCGDSMAFCLPKVMEIIFAWKSDDPSRVLVMGCLIQVMDRVSTFVPRAVGSLATCLRCCFRESPSVPMELRIEAACTLVGLLRVKNGEAKRQGAVVKQIDAYHGVIFSVLSTAAGMDNSSRPLEEILEALLLLSKSSVFSRKLRKRRCAATAACKQLLEHEKSEVRFKALSLCRFFLEARERDDAALLETNSALVANALLELLQSSQDTNLLMEALQAVDVAFRSKTLHPKLKERLLDCVLRLAHDDNDTTESVKVKAGLSYLKATSRTQVKDEILIRSIEFLDSPHGQIREASLLFIKDISFWNPRFLLRDSLGCIDKLAEIIADGSDQECTQALQICRQLSSEDGSQTILCMNHSLLASIIALVTRDPIVNRPAYINGVHILIALMADDSNMPSFLPYDALLPWLIDLANCTSDDDMKQKLVSVIIRYTVAKLGEISPTAASF